MFVQYTFHDKNSQVKIICTQRNGKTASVIIMNQFVWFHAAAPPAGQTLTCSKTSNEVEIFPLAQNFKSVIISAE